MSKTGKTDEKGVRLKFLVKKQFGLGRFDSNPIRPDFRMYLRVAITMDFSMLNFFKSENIG